MRNNKLSFCIPTAKNELSYLKLLLKSLENNLKYNHHEIIIFIDSDNQGTFDWLKNQKKRFKNLKIFNNNLGYPVGYQFNANYMFNQATNEIVCLLQSDMVISQDFDVNALKNVTDKSFFSAVRIEPSIQPENPNEKYTMDFGLNPEEFDNDAFDDFCSKKMKNSDITDLMSIPFIVYKKLWDDLGGFDTTYRWAKEDWDIKKRFELQGIEFKAIWSCLVYHFTSVSSKGTDWFSGDHSGALKIQAQRFGDMYETQKFIRKWKSNFYETHDYRYKNTAFLHTNMFTNYENLIKVEPYFDKIYITNQSIVDDVIYHLRDEHKYQFGYYWGIGYDMEHFNKYSKYVNIQNNKDKFIVVDSFDDIDNDDISVTFGLNELNEERLNFIKHLNNTIHQADVGSHSYDIFQINIKNKINNIMDYVKVDNPSLEGLEFENA